MNGESTGRGPLQVLLGWLPLLAALGLLAQIGLVGLRPALEEQERLRAAEQRVLDRHRELLEESRRLEAEAAAWEDPIFRERLRRLEARRVQAASAD